MPIRENVELSTSAVLTVNHVVEIIAECYNNDGDWKKALEIAIPVRKRIGKEEEAKSEDEDKEEEKS